MKYFVVTEYEDCDLSNLIDTWLEYGWRPVGGVATAVIPKGFRGLDKFGTKIEAHIQYWQAMVHEGDEPFYPEIRSIE